MAKTYDLYESSEWENALPEERELMDSAESKAALLKHTTLGDKYLALDDAGQRGYEARMTQARQNAFPQYFVEEIPDVPQEEEPDTPQRMPHNSGVPFTATQSRAHAEMQASRIRYPGGVDQVKQDEKILSTIDRGLSSRLSENELSRAQALLQDPRLTRKSLNQLKGTPDIQRPLARVSGIKDQLRSWERDYDALAKEADNSALESIRPRATRLKSEIKLLEETQQATPAGTAQSAMMGGFFTSGSPKPTKASKEAQKRAEELFGEDVDFKALLQRKRDEQETLTLNVQMNLLASDEASGHRPNIRGESARGNTPEWIDLIPLVADTKDAKEMFSNIKMLNAQQEAIALGRPDPLSEVEQARVGRFLTEIQSEGKGSRATVGIMNGVADMYPYAMAIATGTGVVAGGRAALLKGAKTNVKKRVAAHFASAAATAAVASSVSSGTIVAEAGRASIDPEVLNAEFNTEEGKALTNYLDLENPVTDKFTRRLFEGYTDNYLENMTEMVGGGVTRGLLFGRAAYGRRVMAANVKRINPHMTTGQLNKLMLKFEHVLGNRHVKKAAAVSDAVLLGRGTSKIQKGLGAMGLDGFGGEIMEEGVSAMKDTLLEIGLAEDDKSGHTLAQKIMNPTYLFDPTQGGDAEDWVVLAATIGLPGSLRTGGSFSKMYKNRQTKKRLALIKSGEDLLTNEDGTRVVPKGNQAQELELLDTIEEAERAEQQKKVDTAEEAIAKQEEALEDRIEINAPETHVEARRKVLSRRLDEYAAALFDQRTTEGQIQERRTQVEGSVQSQVDNLHEAVGEMDAWHDKAITRLAARRANGFVGTKEWKDTIQALVTGLTPIHLKVDRHNTVDKIYRTLRFGGASPRAQRSTRKEVADVVRGYGKQIVKRKGGIVHMSQALSQVAPSMYNRLNYHELGWQVRKAENLALEGLDTNATEGEIIKAMEDAGRAVVSDALDTGFFPIAGAGNAAHKKLLTAAQDEIKVWESAEGEKFTVLDEAAWAKFSPQDQRALARYLTRVADLPEGANLLEALTAVTIAEVDPVKMAKEKGRKQYLREVLGGVAPNLVPLLDDQKLVGRWGKIVVVPDTVIKTASRETGHFGVEGEGQMVTRAFNVGDTLYVSRSATRADLTEESIERQMAENGFFSNPVTTGIATEALQAHVSLLLTQLNEKALELQQNADNKGIPVQKTIKITQNKGLPNESVSEVRLDEEISRLELFLEQLEASNENRTLFEFLSSVFTLHVGGVNLDAKDRESYSSRSDVKTYTALIDLALTFGRSKDAFNNFLVNMAELYFPSEQWNTIQKEGDHPSPLGGALEDSKVSKSALTWSLNASTDFIEANYDVVDDTNLINTPESTLAEMVGGVWDESAPADDTSINDELLEQTLTQAAEDEAIRELQELMEADEAEAEADTQVAEDEAEQAFQAEADRLGIDFEGMQEQFEAPPLAMFSADGKTVTFAVPEGQSIEETLKERRADQAKKAASKKPKAKWTHVDRRGEAEKEPEFAEDVEDAPKKPKTPAIPLDEQDLELHGGAPISSLPNKGALINAANEIKAVLGGHAFEITGRKVMPRATLWFILKNPAVLGKLSQDQLQLMVDRIDLFNGVTPSSTDALTGEPLTNDELLERLIQEVLTLSDAIDLKYADSPLVTGGVATVEELESETEVPAEEKAPDPTVAGAKAAQNLLSEYLKEKSPLHEYGAVNTYIEELISEELKKPGGAEFVAAFMESFYYRSPVPKTLPQLRLASESIANKVTVEMHLKAIEGAAITEGQTKEIEEDEDQELVAGGADVQFLEYGVRFAADTKKLFEKLKLQGTFGPRFVMRAIQESTNIRAVIKQGAAINSRWLDDKKYTVKERNQDIERVVESYLNHGTFRAEESLLVETLQKAGLSKLAIFNAFRDLTTRFHNANIRPASKVEGLTEGFGEKQQVILRTVPYAANAGTSMVASLATTVSRKLSTKAEALRFFDLIEDVSKMGREYVYNFWALMLSEPAEVLEYADVQIGEELKEKKPGLPQSAKELGPLFAFAKDPNAKGNWPQVVQDYRKKVEEADPAEFQELMAEVSRKLRVSSGLTTAANQKAKGLNRIAQIALNMPDSTAPSSYRRPDGTLKSNINSPDQLTQMIELERKRQEGILGEDHPLWILRELDMIDARRLRGGRRAINFEDLLEGEHVRIHRNIWETARKQNQTYYDAWSGPIGDKTSIRTVSMPLKKTYAEAVKYYEATIAEGGLLTAEERDHEAVKSVDEILAAGERGQLDNSEAGLTFEFNDRANRLLIMHAIHGNFAKFGDSVSFTKRASATGSSGVTMTKEGFGDSNLKALRLKDPAFLTTALQDAIDGAELKVAQATSKQAKQRAQTNLEQVQAEADTFLASIESTDGAALILPQARDRIQWAYGPLLTQEDRYGSLKVAKTLHTGHEGLDKQGATILTEDYANHAEGSAYRVILDAIAAHLKKLDPTMEDAVAKSGGRGDTRIDVVFFSSGDKAKSGKEYDLFTEGASQEIPESSLTDVPVDDFYWLLSASHDTQSSAMAMPVQAVAVLSGIPGVFRDALDLQDASVAYAAANASKQLNPKDIIQPDDHVLAPYALGKTPLIPVDNVFLSQMLSNKQSIKLSKEGRPVIMGNQLVETPLAAPPEVLADYYKVSEADDGLWDADENGTRVRLARADFNSDNVRFALTTSARTAAEAEALMRNPDVFPMVLDMFEISRAVLRDLPETFDAEFINGLEFRSWELEKDGEFIKIPGEPVLVQRVPSDGVYSTSTVRAGSRILTKDGESPNIIATSQGVQIGSGADFDIDKRFVMSMRRSNTKAADIPEGPGRDFAEQTYVANKELKQSRTNVGYDLTSPRWSSYNRFLLGLTSDFGDVKNFEAITSKLDGDLNKQLVDKAVAEAKMKDKTASWERDLASLHGAVHLYKLNAIGKKGLGRSATSMFSAGIMYGLGYGVVKDQSFKFTTNVNGEPVTMEIKVNRKAGDRSNFQIARSSIGLVMNQYTDHTKLQVIDKLGGDEITASLFATLYYLNKDLVPDDAPAEGKDTVSDYGEVIWRALASPEIQAWSSLSRLNNKMALTPADLKILRMQEREKTAIPMKALKLMFEQENPEVTPNTELWDIILGGSQEMLEIERLFRGYRNPMPIDPISMFHKKQGWMKRANGIVEIVEEKVNGKKVWKGVPALFQMPDHASPEAQAVILNRPYDAMERRVHHAFRPTLTSVSTAVANVEGLEPVTKTGSELDIETAPDAPTHRDIYNRVREDLTGAVISQETEQGDTIEVSADTSKDGLRKIQTAMNRLVFSTAVMASYPERVGRKELIARVDAGLKSAYLADPNNVFLTEGISAVRSGEGLTFEVPSGTAGNERSAAELARFYAAFTELPPTLKQDLLLYAVMQYGMPMHNSFGSFLGYIDPTYLLPFINGANSLSADNFNFPRAQSFAIRASRADRPQVLNLNDVAHDAPEIVTQAAEATVDSPARPIAPHVKQVFLDHEALTEEQAEKLELTENDGLKQPTEELKTIGPFPMYYKMPVSAVREGLRSQYPQGTSTAELMNDGFRTATTRIPFAGVGFTVSFNDVEGEWSVVSVEKPDFSTPEGIARWEEREGWSFDYIKSNPKLLAQVTASRSKQTVLEKVEARGTEETPALDYELNGVSRADWEIYFKYNTQPLTAASLVSQTVANMKIAGLPTAKEIATGQRQINSVHLDDLNLTYIKSISGTWHRLPNYNVVRDAATLKMIEDKAGPDAEIKKGEVVEISELYKWVAEDLGDASTLTLKEKFETVRDRILVPELNTAAVAFLHLSLEERKELKKVVNRVRKAMREKVQVTKDVAENTAANTAALITGDTAAEIKRMMESDPRDIDGGLSQSAFFTKMIEVDARGVLSNRKGREFLLKHTRQAEKDHTILSAAAKRWQTMTNSRDGTYNNIYQDERPGEAMLKALTVMYEAGIRSEADFRRSQTAQNLYDEYPAKAPAKSRESYNEYIARHPNVVRADLIYYWDSPEDVTKVAAQHGGGYTVPKSKRILVSKVVRDYEEALRATNSKAKVNPKHKDWMSTWEEVMSDYAKTLDDAVRRMNANAGFNWITKPDDRVFHVIDTPSDRGSTAAPSALGSPEEAETTFLENSSYLDMVTRGLKPASFNASENFAAWLNNASARARLVGVLRASALTTDVNGVPGMIMGATATAEGEKLTPYDRSAGFIMLTNLRKKISERPEVKLPVINRTTSPWVQAAEIAEAYPKAMQGLGYVRIKTHVLGPNVDQVWAIQGTLDKVIQHVSVAGFKGHLQQARSEGGLGSAAWMRTLGWGTLTALLSATKFLKGLNVGFSAFHHFALAESAVANVGLTFKNPIFHLGNYWMAGRRGLKMYREMTADPTLAGKWAGRGLKATTLPLDALHYEMTSGWFSWAGKWFRNDGKGIFKKTKLGDAVGSTILLAGNVKKAADNLLWHGMVPVMKVHMAEQMFENFRAQPQLKHLTDEQLGHDISKYVNDALGGQEWEQYMFMNPLMQDWANMIMFAPDWTLSALNVAGMSKAMSEAFGLDGPMNYTDEALKGAKGPFALRNGKFEFTGSPIVRQRVLKYLPGFFMNVLVMPPVAIQAMIFLAFGSPDDGDEMWVWNNEEGKKFRIDFTPILREYQLMRGVEPPERRAYWTPGKQLREIGGWLQHPAKTLYGKSSNVVRMSNLIVFKSKTHPFSPQPWTVDREDVAMEAMYSMMPFVASGWLSDTEVPLGMRTFLTVTRGASEWTLANRASEVYKDAASGKGYRGASATARVRRLNDELSEIWRTADINKIDVRTIQIEGRKQARTEFNALLMDEMSKPLPSAAVMEELLLSLAVLEPNYSDRLDSLKRTVDYRVKKSAKLSKEEKARIQSMYDSFKFRAMIRKTTDAHTKAWGRTGGVSIDPDA